MVMDKEIEAKLQRLFAEINTENSVNATGFALELLGGFMTDIKRIADALEHSNDLALLRTGGDNHGVG